MPKQNKIAKILMAIGYTFLILGGILALYALLQTESSVEVIMGFEFYDDEWTIASLFSALSYFVTYGVPGIGFLALSEVVEELTRIRMKLYGQELIDYNAETGIREPIKEAEENKEVNTVSSIIGDNQPVKK